MTAAVACGDALLVGLRLDRAKAVSTYRSVWISPGTETPKLELGSSLLLHRQDGWWRVGVRRWRGNPEASFVDPVWAHRLGSDLWTESHRVALDSDCSAENQARILFLGPGHVTVEANDYGYCKEAAGPFSHRGLRTVTI